MATEQDELIRLRLDLANTERLRREAEQKAAELDGRLKSEKCADAGKLKQELADAQSALQSATDDLKKLNKKLVDAEQAIAEETARADRTGLEASTLRGLNVDLTAVVQVLKTKQTTVINAAPAAPATPTHDDISACMPWYKKGKKLALVGGVVLALVLAVCIIKLVSNWVADDDADAVKSAESAPATESEPKPDVKQAIKPAPVVPSIQPKIPPRSRSCQYASLNACVDDITKGVGGVPSELVQSRGTYWCQQIGCL